MVRVAPALAALPHLTLHPPHSPPPQVVKLIGDQQTAAMWGSIYDEMYVADGLQVTDGVDDPTMDWAAYTDSFTGLMHERDTIEEVGGGVGVGWGGEGGEHRRARTP